ncbi:MAG: hypothetical protein LBD25_01610 [Coriobacteriales bacterium]|jgi:hypothetical protein|nr:hypothetical protein [Coriobacteriales bacterium]
MLINSDYFAANRDISLRLVAAYYSLDIKERAKVWDVYTDGTFTTLAASPNDLRSDAERLKKKLADNSIDRQTFEGILGSAGADELRVCLFRYRLYKRRSWAKRRVTSMEYDDSARWKTFVSLDINQEYLDSYSARYAQGGDEGSPERRAPFYNIPILEVNKKDQFVSFSANDCYGTAQLSKKNISNYLSTQMLVGSIAEEYWDDDTVPMPDATGTLMNFLKEWFDENEEPGFVRDAKEGIFKDQSLKPRERDALLDDLYSYEWWVSDMAGNGSMFMSLLKNELSLWIKSCDKRVHEELCTQFDYYAHLPVFIWLMTTLTFKWVAYLKIDNRQRANMSTHFNYVLARDILGAQKRLGPEPRTLKKGPPFATGIEACFPLVMLGQSESDHYTLKAPEGTFFSDYASSRHELSATAAEKLRVPFFIRFRKKHDGQASSEGDDLSKTEDEFVGDGSIAPGHITLKACQHWEEDGEPSRRLYSKKSLHPAHDFELFCRLRPRLGLRSVAYGLLLALSLLLWTTIVMSRDEIDGILNPVSFIAVVMAVTISLDKESFLRKRMFLFPKILVIAVAALDTIIPWCLAFIGPLITSCYSITHVVKWVALVLVGLALIAYLCWVVRHWLHAKAPERRPGYFDKSRLLSFLHPGSGTNKLVRYIPYGSNRS